MNNILNKFMHRYSGICIALFIGPHLVNHLLSVAGANAHQAFMNVLRLVYRNPVIESVLLLCVLYQVVSGIQMVRGRLPLNKNEGFALWQVVSGLYLSLFLVVHVSAVIFFHHIKGVDTNYHFIVYGFTHIPALYFFIPYYSMAVLMLFTHLACVHYRKMCYYVAHKNAAIQARVIISLGVVCTIIIVGGYSCIR